MEGNGASGKPLIHTSEDLRAHFGQLSPLAEKKVLHHLDKFCRDFIALSPFLVLASSDGKGNAVPPDQTLVFLVSLTKVEYAP